MSLNLFDLINQLRSNPENVTHIIDQLWIDFYSRISDNVGHIIFGCPNLFVAQVNVTLKQMDLLYNSVKNANCNYVWVALFNKIRNVAFNYYIFIVDKKFLNLEFRYSEEKIEVAEVKNEALEFMRLKQIYTRDDLIKSYRRLVMKYHPDKGGRVEDFRKLQVYKEQLEREFN